MILQTMNEKLTRLVGKKVIATVNKLQVVCKLVSLAPGFQGRDVIVELPVTKKHKRIWASKIEEIKP